MLPVAALLGVVSIVLGALVLIGVDDPVTLLAIAVIVLGAVPVVPLLFNGTAGTNWNWRQRPPAA